MRYQEMQALFTLVNSGLFSEQEGCAVLGRALNKAWQSGHEHGKDK